MPELEVCARAVGGHEDAIAKLGTGRMASLLATAARKAVNTPRIRSKRKKDSEEYDSMVNQERNQNVELLQYFNHPFYGGTRTVPQTRRLNKR